MAQFESFRNSKQKIQKTWERSEQNTNNLNDVPLVTLDFNSINFNKKIATVPIATNKLFGFFTENVQTVLLENFPEWAINMIEVTCIYTMEDAFVNFPLIDDFNIALNNGTLKIGDISITEQEFDYWFNNIDQTNFSLKIFLRAIARQIRSINLGVPSFQTDSIPLFFTLSLKILNQRIYETMNEKKE